VVSKEDWQVIERLVDDCVNVDSYNAVKAFADLNRYLGKLREERKKVKKDERA